MLIIIAIIVLVMLPSPWSYVAFVGAVALWVGELLFWRHRVKDYREAVGPQTLVGRSAEVVSPCRPVGQVRFDGELWSAHCAEGADVGQRVCVTGRNRLTLDVTTTLD